jgi:hypothetical protein
MRAQRGRDCRAGSVRTSQRVLSRIDEEIGRLGSRHQLELVLADLVHDVIDPLIFDERSRGVERLVAYILELLLQRSDLPKTPLIEVGPSDGDRPEEEAEEDESAVIAQDRKSPEVVLDPFEEIAVGLLFFAEGLLGRSWLIRPRLSLGLLVRVLLLIYHSRDQMNLSLRIGTT